MEFVTTETVPGREIEETLGIARGNTVKARNVGRDITQSIRNITGGELKAYSELLSDARDEALERMEEDAWSAWTPGSPPPRCFGATSSSRPRRGTRSRT